MEEFYSGLSKEDIVETLKKSHSKQLNAIIHGASVSAAGVGGGLAQIPMADAIPLTAIQAGMLFAIAHRFKINVTEAAVKSLLATFATMIAGRHISGSLIGMIPGAGNIVKASTAALLTEAIGWEGVNYFAGQFAEQLYEESKIVDPIGKGFGQKFSDTGGKTKKAFKEYKVAVLEFHSTRRETEKLFKKNMQRLDKDFVTAWENERNTIDDLYGEEIKNDKFSHNSPSFKRNEALYDKIMNMVDKDHVLSLDSSNNRDEIAPAEEINSLADEAIEVGKRAEHTGEIYIKKALDFEKKTALNNKDMTLLFIGVALHAARIFILNKLLDTTKANKNKGVEGKAKKVQQKIAEAHKNDTKEKPCQYYAPLNQIYVGRSVPYDATAFDCEVYVNDSDKPPIFKGANHRFSTLGHDPLIGLFVGTINIITNTITITTKGGYKLSDKIVIHDIESYHVKYTDEYKDPVISEKASFVEAWQKTYQRYAEDDDGKEAISAAVIKQVLHIASDIFTVAGIPLPIIMEVGDKKIVEQITKNISAGDVVKQGSMALLAWIINLLIGGIHARMYREDRDGSPELYSIKTREVVDTANLIASTSSVVASLVAAYASESAAPLKSADFGGMYVAIKRILYSEELRNKIRNEFISKGVLEEIIG